MNTRTPAALVASALLLTVAAAGSGYAAAQITGADVRNGSLTGIDVRDGTLGSADVANNNLRTGDIRNGTIRPGDLAPGLRKQRVVARKATKTSSSSNDSLQSDCLAGEQAVGGHAGIGSGNIAGLQYFDPGGEPVVVNGVVTGWRASWFNQNNNNNEFEVTALCMSPAPVG